MLASTGPEGTAEAAARAARVGAEAEATIDVEGAAEAEIAASGAVACERLHAPIGASAADAEPATTTICTSVRALRRGLRGDSKRA